jgi:hypothetical protein
MDNSMALSDGGVTIAVSRTITTDTSQYTETADKTQVGTSASTLTFTSEPPLPPIPPPTRSLLNSCIIVLTVTSSMVVNVRGFLSYFSPRWLTCAFQLANTTAMSIALPTIQKEMNLEPAQLQWIMSAYPLSSVSGTPQSVIWQSRRQFSTLFSMSISYMNHLLIIVTISQILGLPLPCMR